MRTLGAVLAVFVSCSAAGAAPVVVRVAPDGREAGEGVSAPFATLERARDEVRRLKTAGLAPEGIVVEIAAGTYALPRSFELGAADGGTSNAPVVYRAVRPGAVRISGGRRVTAWTPVAAAATLARLDPAARGRVMQADLRAAGATNFGKIPDVYRGQPPLPGLVCDDRIMTLARWPNEGWWTIGKTVDSGAKRDAKNPKGRPGAFLYHGDRHARWAKPQEAILRGYWTHDWYEEGLRIASLDPQERKIVFAAPSAYGIGGRMQRYYAINV
ncbi:MAG: hypothetical protein KJ579_03625, partial [Verrucomicrobia bacterium]|nr:hypothetical protein [Verrucomicrobiota bacterium]